MPSSSLRDLLKLAKQRDVAPLLPDIERFLMTRDADPHWDVDWEGKDVWHPSSISYGMCARYEQLSRLRPDLMASGSRPAPSLLRIFKMGSGIHSYYQNDILGPMGILWGMWIDLLSSKVEVTAPGTQRHEEGWTALGRNMFRYEVGTMPSTELIAPGLRRWFYVEPPVFDPENNIGGHTDGILLIDGKRRGLEIKSINARGFDHLQAPRPHHERQCQLYMHGSKQAAKYKAEGPPHLLRFEDLDEYCVLYVNKNTSREKEFTVRYSPEVLSPMLVNVNRATRGLVKHELGARSNACRTIDSKAAKECVACAVCFQVGTGKEGWREVELMEVSRERR